MIKAIRLTEPIRVDGRLDEVVYETYRGIDHFIQALPREGAPATERTEAWVLFDGRNIYISARCWDSAPPSLWLANEMRRDQIQNSDNFAVSLDTFHDRRNSFVFQTTPLGALADFITTDEGSPNRDWNPVWNVRTDRFDGGWSVEMAIPYKSIRYQSGSDMEWGLQLRRGVRRKNEWAFLAPVPAAWGGPQAISRPSIEATLTGLDLPAASRNVELKPYGISKVATDRLKTPAVSNDVDGDFGIDAKYGITANLTADVTYNTDFAQVEVDEQQVNLTRFSLFFPEKREFFLEGRGQMDFGLGATGGTSGDTPLLFYSRRIGFNRNTVVPLEGGWARHRQGGQVRSRADEHPNGRGVRCQEHRPPTSRSCASSATSCGAAPWVRYSPTARHRAWRAAPTRRTGWMPRSRSIRTSASTASWRGPTRPAFEAMT